MARLVLRQRLPSVAPAGERGTPPMGVLGPDLLSIGMRLDFNLGACQLQSQEHLYSRCLVLCCHALQTDSIQAIAVTLCSARECCYDSVTAAAVLFSRPVGSEVF